MSVVKSHSSVVGQVGERVIASCQTDRSWDRLESCNRGWIWQETEAVDRHPDRTLADVDSGLHIASRRKRGDMPGGAAPIGLVAHWVCGKGGAVVYRIRIRTRTGRAGFYRHCLQRGACACACACAGLLFVISHGHVSAGPAGTVSCTRQFQEISIGTLIRTSNPDTHRTQETSRYVQNLERLALSTYNIQRLPQPVALGCGCRRWP